MQRVRFTYYPSHDEIFAFHEICEREGVHGDSRHCAWTSALTTGRAAFNIYRSLAASLKPSAEK